MGCDIHLYKEKLVNGKWVAANTWVAYDYGDDDKGLEVPFNERFTGRNYDLFGLLSKGVRSDFPFAFEPRGVPFNACEEYKQDVEAYGEDGHGHSYLYLHELKDMAEYLKSKTIEISGMKDKKELAALNVSEPKDWNLLYPYCKWASSAEYEKFTFDVPADFICGGGLEEIIDSFEGIDGDNHRIVFYFDN